MKRRLPEHRPAARPAHPQRGVALITALLVVALAATAAAAMISRNQLDIRRTENMLHFEQATAYAQGAEQWALAILRRDRKDGDTDTLDEDWATVLPPVPVEGGGLSGHIEDLQGRLNLNNLIKEGKPSELDQKRLQRLLLMLELDPALAQALLDWLDPDIEPRYPDGAEDDVYSGLSPAYRTANGPLADISELRLIQGFDDKVMEKLTPYVCALPEYTPLNINTAPAMLLRTLADDVSEADIEGLLESRGEKGFASVQKFLEDKAFAGRELTEEGLALSSNYFMVHSLIYIGRIRLPMASLIHRATVADTRVLQRSREDG